MGKFEYFPSNVNVVARVISVERDETKYENNVIYRITATQNCSDDLVMEEVLKIIFEYSLHYKETGEFYELLSSGDIIECIGSIEGSDHGENGEFNGSYGVCWHEINLVYKVAEEK